jgi:hypothetical protein
VRFPLMKTPYPDVCTEIQLLFASCLSARQTLQHQLEGKFLVEFKCSFPV